MTTIQQGSAARAASVLWLVIAIGCGEAAYGAPFDSNSVSSMAVIGDSMARAYNAGGGEFFEGGCPFTDQLSFSWATNDNNATLCRADTVYSHKERLECANSKNLSARNVAVSGANMRDDAYKQAVAARNWLVTRAAPRYIAFLLGHNDICQGHRDRSSTCTPSSTKDPNNYCRTTRFAFERTVIPLAARVDSTCPWPMPTVTAGLQGHPHPGDHAFAAVAPSANVPANATFGTGNVTKATGVQIQYSEAISNYQFKSSDIQNCDCFHASHWAQNRISQYLYRGLTCTATTPCCRDVGTNDVDDGKCRRTWTDGRKIPALAVAPMLCLTG